MAGIGLPAIPHYTLSAIALLIAATPCHARETPPPPPSAAQLRAIGDYGAAEGDAEIAQQNGALMLQRAGRPPVSLAPAGHDRWRSIEGQPPVTIRITRSAAIIDGATLPRHDFGAEVQAGIRKGARVDGPRLRAAALAVTPPAEPPARRPDDLVALADVVPHVRLDIRYAGTNNFLGTAVYDRPGAWLQRPAAEALARAARALAEEGYGLVIYDAYRPWFATRMFWDAVPAASHVFVADPAEGSRHNRGCAVDLGLVDLKTGKPIEMPSRYDEFSRRAFPDYAAGTDRQRWFRDRLRRAMEAEGFTVYPQEWWHFDCQGWQDYAIGTRTFGELERRAVPPRH